MFYNMLRHAVDNYAFLDKETPVLSLLGSEGNVVSKRPLDIFDIDKIPQANVHKKDVHLIVLVRDIRSIMTSRHQGVANDYFIGYDYQYFISANKAPQYINPGIIKTHNAIFKAYETKACKNILFVKFEDLVSDPASIQQRLGCELDFTYKDSFEDFHQGTIPAQLQAPLNSIRSVDKTRIDSWREEKHKQRVLSQFSRCPALFDILIQYGYELDRSWFEEYASG